MIDAKKLLDGITPGEWYADKREGCFAVFKKGELFNCLSGANERAIVYQEGRGEESSSGHYRYLTKEQEANADIIAAAPALARRVIELEAYKEQHEEFCGNCARVIELENALRELIDAASKAEESWAVSKAEKTLKGERWTLPE